ncbi:MAG: threonine synthase [Bacteroidales bacterium]|nr:threonine synthase [Bacteroidales bacterium]
MLYYSTNRKAPLATLEKAVVQGLAEDRGLYMPERIPVLPPDFYRHIQILTFPEIACTVADALFGEDIPREVLHRIVEETLSFDCPAVPVTRSISALELFHGPTLAFKDVGARFMARLLGHFTRASQDRRTIHVLVATSGDTGSAVANGFLGVEGVQVHVLYPKGGVSAIQESQFTTLGQNITALAVEGSFDDCQALVKNAFMDPELNGRLRLTSANSINVARLLPQSFYYFHGYAQMKRLGLADQLVVCVPSGNFGNLCAALIAGRMGLPVHRYVAANNANDVFFQYLETGSYAPRPSIPTLANAMDVGAPSNFDRVLDLYGGDWESLCADVSGEWSSDAQIRATIKSCLQKYGYLLDPHGACGFRAVYHHLLPGESALFCETAHPAKFKDTVEEASGVPVAIPERLAAFMRGEKKSVPMGREYPDFKAYLSGLK